MNGKMVIGNTGINCIEMAGGATLKNGTVVNCREGIVVEGSRNRLIGIESSNNERRGFRIRNGNENVLYKCLAEGNDRTGFSIEGTGHNLLTKCSAINNGRQGFSIEGEGADDNKLYSSEAKANCRDGIEINEGNGNSVVNNLVEDNGNLETCNEKGEDYNPWFYAGIDVTNNSNNNEIKYNSACGNLGCVSCYDEFGEPTCQARERNFWDENVSDIGDSVSTNVREKNRIFCKNVMPEYSPEP